MRSQFLDAFSQLIQSVKCLPSRPGRRRPWVEELCLSLLLSVLLLLGRRPVFQAKVSYDVLDLPMLLLSFEPPTASVVASGDKLTL